MLTEDKIVDKIEVVASGAVQVRESFRILRDGVVVSEQYHRYCLVPGSDLEGRPASVVAICQAAWTPEVVSAFNAASANGPKVEVGDMA